MKAIVHSKYGPPEELQLKEVEKPSPGNHDVLIKVHATSVSSTDCNMRNFTFVPKLILLPSRIQFGFKEPKNKILGLDFSGEVEVVGKEVKKFRKGDQVFGISEPALGAYAENLCIPEEVVLIKKSPNLTHEQAAVLPLAGSTALYFIRDLANVQAGQKILVNGASGAIGTYAIQIAKHLGAEVTGVCSTTNIEMVRSLGADNVIDYTKEDFTQNGETYDIIFDAVGKSSFVKCKGSLKINGTYLVTLPTLAVLLQMIWTSIVGRKKVKMGSGDVKTDDLIFLKELVISGKLKPIIDRTYPLNQIAKAFRYVEKGHKRGNVVITVAQSK